MFLKKILLVCLVACTLSLYSNRSRNPLGYYRILKVDHNASQDDIKRAYRKGALRWHPDKNQNNQEEATRKFQDLQKAYEVLRDPAQRRTYDSSHNRSYSSWRHENRTAGEQQSQQNRSHRNSSERTHSSPHSSRNRNNSDSYSYEDTDARSFTDERSFAENELYEKAAAGLFSWAYDKFRKKSVFTKTIGVIAASLGVTLIFIQSLKAHAQETGSEQAFSCCGFTLRVSPDGSMMFGRSDYS